MSLLLKWIPEVPSWKTIFGNGDHQPDGAGEIQNKIKRSSEVSQKSFTKKILHGSKGALVVLLKMGLSRPLFVYFCHFLITISIIQIEKSVDGVLGILNRGRYHIAMVV